MSSRCFCGILWAAVGLLSSLATHAAPWRTVASDQTWDAAWIRGTLENGLTYAVRTNAHPKERVSLRLLVSVGSLHEEDGERGIAHLVEHMVFRGTRAYPGDELNRTLQRKGIAMGPDHTAFTGYDLTIYHLELPDTSEATIKLGLVALREYASAATFDPVALSKERGVVLNEKASRDLPDQQRAEFNVDFLWPNSRQARREVVGTEETLRTITREQLVAFYDAWYRPERMAVVAVGDMDAGNLQRWVQEVFSSVAGRGDPRPEPPDLVPQECSSPDVALFARPELVGVELAFQHPQFKPRTQSSRADRIAALHRELAFAMFQQRLLRVADDSDDTLNAPTVSVQRVMPDWETAVFTASARMDGWRGLAAAVEQEHRRAYLGGFASEELKLARDAFAERYDTFVRVAPSRRSESYAAEMATALLYGHVMVTPEALREDMAEPLAKATAADCLAAFRSAWGAKALHVLVSANAAFPAKPSEIGQVLNESRSVGIAERGSGMSTEFAYQDFGSPGVLVKEELLADLDLRLSTFANGVRFNHKETRFEADMVDGSVRVSGGWMHAPMDKPGLKLLADLGFISGGVGRHRMADLRDLLAAHSIFVDFNVDGDAFVFRLKCTRKDFPMAMQLVAAYLTDAAFRPEALRPASGSYHSSLAASLSQAGGLIRMSAAGTLFGGDPRLKVPLPEEFTARTMQDLREWLASFLAKGEVEAAVVGDIPWEDARTTVAQTLGALSPRAERFAVARERQPGFSPPLQRPVRLPTKESFKQVSIAWYWPVKDVMDAPTERRCHVLAAVFQERLWKRLREELGATYSPGLSFVPMDGVPGLSYFVLQVDVGTEHAADAAALIKREMRTLAKKGVPKDEFERVKAPFLRTRRDSLRENSYWCFSVLDDAQRRPERLVAARNREADTAAITAKEIRDLFRRHITREKGFLFLSEPGGTVQVFDGK